MNDKNKYGFHIQDFNAAYVPQYQEVIKNKPETSIQASEIIGGVMHIMEQRKERNTVVRNIRRLK